MVWIVANDMGVGLIVRIDTSPHKSMAELRNESEVLTTKIALKEQNAHLPAYGLFPEDLVRVRDGIM